jgi:hypothetical protein
LEGESVQHIEGPEDIQGLECGEKNDPEVCGKGLLGKGESNGGGQEK